MLLAVADEVGAAHVFERFAQQRPVGGVVVAQKCLVQTAAALAFGGVDFFGTRVAVYAFQGIQARVVHGRGSGHGAGVEGLHLVGAKAVALEPQGQVHHVFVAGAGVGGDEVGDEKLLFAGLGVVLVKQLLLVYQP